MKTFKIFSLTIFWFFIFSGISRSQDIGVHNLIGKKQNDVIKKFGNPAHKDNSNPDMVCMFYKNSSRTMVFVSDKDGVYQAEATITYDTEQGARKIIDDLISVSVNDGFSMDTVTVNDFKLHHTGVNVELHLSENKISKKFEIRVKANRTEE